MDLVLIVVIVAVVVWYFGSSIKAVLSGAGEMASDEFTVNRAKQSIRIRKEYEKLGKQIEEADFKHSKSTVFAMLNDLDDSSSKED